MASPTRTYRWLIVASISALALSGLTGVARAQEESPSPAVAPEPSLPQPSAAFACAPDATPVDFWTEHTPPDSDTMIQIVDAFNQANPDLCAKMTIVPGSETDIAKLLAAIRGGVAPDVYLVDRFTIPQRASEGVVEPLPEEAAGMAGQYLPFAWAETQFQGGTYALPFDTDARALFYNIDLIEAAGQDPAQLDIANGPPTIAEVNAIADAITTEDANGNYEVMGWIPGGPGAAGQPGALDQGWHYTWGFAHGGSFADLEACQVTPTDPGVVAGYQFLYDWAAERDPQKITRFVSTVMPDPTGPAQQNAFITGKLGMVVTGDWRFNQMRQLAPDTNYGFTYIPVPNEGDESATWAGGWSAALIPGSENPDAAWRFIQYLAGPEGQAAYTRGTTHLPTLGALLEDASLYDEQHAQFLDLLAVAHNRPPLSVGAIYWDALTSAQGSVELNSAEPAAALQEVADTVQPQLDAIGC
jgi:multiple sugar transport system substrate-binding protein